MAHKGRTVGYRFSGQFEVLIVKPYTSTQLKQEMALIARHDACLSLRSTETIGLVEGSI